MGRDLYQLMEEALAEARKGFEAGEVPVGAVVADLEGRVISRAHNQPVTLNDPTAHAEILAIRRAASFCGNYRLNHTVLVVTVEPCIMCAGAAINARVHQLVFGAYDPKAGAAGSLYELTSDQRLNHRLQVVSGVREQECRALVQAFFRVRR